MDCNINIRYARYLIGDSWSGRDPQGGNQCSQWTREVAAKKREMPREARLGEMQLLRPETNLGTVEG